MSAHVAKIGGDRRQWLQAERLDRYHVGQLRWMYRHLRRQGVDAGSARMALHSAYCLGFTAGHRYGLDLGPIDEVAA